MLLWRISLYSTILLTLVSVPFIGYDSAAKILTIGGILIGIFIAVSLLVWLALLIICWTIPLNKDYEKPSKGYYKVFNAGYAYLCRLAGARVHVSGLEKVPFDKPFLFVSNHRSKFDNMIESVALRKSIVAFITKPENFKIPIGRHYMKRSLDNRSHGDSGVIPIYRKITASLHIMASYRNFEILWLCDESHNAFSERDALYHIVKF